MVSHTTRKRRAAKASRSGGGQTTGTSGSGGTTGKPNPVAPGKKPQLTPQQARDALISLYVGIPEITGSDVHALPGNRRVKYSNIHTLDFSNNAGFNSMTPTSTPGVDDQEEVGNYIILNDGPSVNNSFVYCLCGMAVDQGTGYVVNMNTRTFQLFVNSTTWNRHAPGTVLAWKRRS